jgi:hypothetical protein
LDTAEERLKGPIDPQHHILQDLAVNVGVFGQGLLDAGERRLLLGGGDSDAAHAPRLAPLANGGIVERTTQHQRPLKQSCCWGVGCSLYRKVVWMLCWSIVAAIPSDRRKSGKQENNRGSTGPLAFIPVPQGRSFHRFSLRACSRR